MKIFYSLILSIFSFALYAQPFTYTLMLDDANNTLSLVLRNTGGSTFNYNQISTISGLLATGGSSISGVSSSDYGVTWDSGNEGFAQGTVYNSPGSSIAPLEGVTLAVFSLNPGSYTPADFTISPGNIPPQFPSIEFDLISFNPSLGNTVLPIYLSSFDVEKAGQRSANVLWQTSSETNSSHFIVQRSNDTKSWESIGEVAAAGNSTTTIDYSFLDETIPTTLRSGNNVFYYRLVSVDLDESYAISEIRSLSFKPSSTTVSVYPNPTAQHIVVDLTSIEGESTVQILNMEGRLVRQQQVTDEHNGLPVYNLREMGLKRGQYIVRVIESQSGQVHNKKVIYID